MRRAVSILLLSVAAAACSPRTSERQVMVTTRLSVDGLSCICQDPDECPLDCGGAIGLFAIDPYAPEGENILDSYCITFAPKADDSLRELSTHLTGVSFSFPEGTTLALELIVYPGSEEGCPPVEYRGGNEWALTPGMQTPRYAGRSAAQTLGGAQVIFDLPIGCPGFFAECSTSTHKLSTYVWNLSTMGLLSQAQGQSFDVHAAALYNPGGEPVSAALTPIADLALQSTSPDALFETTSETGFGFSSDCIGTIVTQIPGPTVSTASCEGVFGETQITAQSYYVQQSHVDDIVAGLGLTSFPTGGLLVGRLLMNGAPVIGTDQYHVVPMSGTADIKYFEEDVDGHLQLRPTAGSWFAVATAALEPVDQMGPARCCEFFAVVDADENIRAITESRLGVVDGVVTATALNFVQLPPP